MEYRRLGKSGLKLSSLSFGSWVTFSNQLDENRVYELMKTAYDAGVNFFDNAEVYAEGESEILMGKALQKAAWGRDTYCVSSKVFWGGGLPTQKGLSHKHVFDACHAALRRLRVEYLDLFFCHRPDIETPIEETVRAMAVLIQQGKILYWGTSEWSSTQLMEAYAVARDLRLPMPTMEQPQYHMFHRERVEVEYKHLYENFGLGTTIWSPLASGLLTGKYSKGFPSDSRANLSGFEWIQERLKTEQGKERIQKVEQLRPLAKDLGLSLPQLAIAWCLSNPNVSSVLLGASKKEQLVENLKTIELVSKLEPEVLEKIEDVLQNRPEPPVRY